jgi:hypothetical protein
VPGAAIIRPSHGSPHAWAVGSRFWLTPSSLIISAEPPPALSSLLPDALLTVSRQGRARLFHVSGADADANAGERNYLVVAKLHLIMNDIRLRGLAVAGSDATARKSPHNHAQTARNLRRCLRNAVAGARLIQAEGLDRARAVCRLRQVTNHSREDMVF